MVPEAGKGCGQVRWEGRNTAEWGTTSERNKKGQMMCGRDEGELSFGREENIFKICYSTHSGGLGDNCGLAGPREGISGGAAGGYLCKLGIETMSDY